METCELVVTALKEQGRNQDQDLPVSTSCKQTSLLPACCDLQSLERRYIKVKGSGLSRLAKRRRPIPCLCRFASVQVELRHLNFTYTV